MAMPVSYHCAAATDVPPETLYRMLWLRLRVFVVEQRAAYPELDRRDIEPGAELMWASDGDEVLSTLRILADPTEMRIGRVATDAAARGRGIAAELMRLARTEARRTPSRRAPSAVLFCRCCGVLALLLCRCPPAISSSLSSLPSR